MTNEDHVQIIIRFTDGTVADFQQSQIARVGKPRWRILGDKGAILAQGGLLACEHRNRGLADRNESALLARGAL